LTNIEELELFRSSDQCTIVRAHEMLEGDMNALIKRADELRLVWGEESRRVLSGKREICGVGYNFVHNVFRIK
jgi:hypothetical protein